MSDCFAAVLGGRHLITRSTTPRIRCAIHSQLAPAFDSLINHGKMKLGMTGKSPAHLGLPVLCSRLCHSSYMVGRTDSQETLSLHAILPHGSVAISKTIIPYALQYCGDPPRRRLGELPTPGR
ncbi:hypothetical protein Bbelb_360690 [Branchiostoma belcheri]|nr:hypothetical protein Bbelb_360690 [Branchiostoma belcheri]